MFSEPYCNGKNRNRITPGNESFVKKTLYTDEALKAEVASLRETFMNKAEALIHGDLHTGSIFIGKSIDSSNSLGSNSANEHCMKIIDPEFAFYGPIGYDLGNIIANLYCAWMYAAFIRGANAFTERIAAAIEALPQLFTAKALKRCKTVPLSDPLYNEKYIRRRLAEIVADAYGFAGTEMIRRTIGDTKTAEFDAMGSDARRITMERIVIQTASTLIKQRRRAGIGARTAEYFRASLKTRLDF
ncbi:putative S-methyl-5-thioribose kinase [Treponema vincentii ATCC 35580]|uniref:Putative S-methyl-5-thioribose kinase n=1 Tax=Treponema vincentii ATCC 35580 TaxID=596324 RepID=C8PQK0_9SPIR|nr:putative S-methyl-5-thioribose kinase [Treponema vincentii ATCC 35580]